MGTLELIDPSTEAVFDQVELASFDDVDDAVGRVAQANDGGRG